MGNAATVYTQSTSRRTNQKPVDKITLLANGRWNRARQLGAGQTFTHGCLPRPLYREFVNLMARSNFKAPPRPRINCRAVPRNFTTYRDLIRKRTAFSSSPCGRRANADVYKLSARLSALLSKSPTHNPPTTAKCKPGGPAFYMEITSPLRGWRGRPHRGGIKGKPAPGMRRPAPRRPAPTMPRLIVYKNGYWLYRAQRVNRTGCIPARDMARVIRAAKQAKRGRDTKQRVVCKAINNRQTTIYVRNKAYYSWARPCGIRPNPSLMRLYSLVHRLTKV